MFMSEFNTAALGAVIVIIAVLLFASNTLKGERKVIMEINKTFAVVCKDNPTAKIEALKTTFVCSK